MRAEVAEAIAHTAAARRQMVAERAFRIANVSDALLQKVVGVSDLALCKKISASPRVADRLDAMLVAIGNIDAAAAAKAARAQARALAEDEAQRILAEVEIAALPEVILPPDFKLILNRVSGAIMLSTFGALLDRSHIERVSESFGAEVINFGLSACPLVPHWMSVGAGHRVDILQQFAASCIAALGLVSVRQEIPFLLDELAPFDPFPIHDPDACDQAAALAEAALDYVETETEDADVVGE